MWEGEGSSDRYRDEASHALALDQQQQDVPAALGDARERLRHVGGGGDRTVAGAHDEVAARIPFSAAAPAASTPTTSAPSALSGSS